MDPEGSIQQVWVSGLLGGGGAVYRRDQPQLNTRTIQVGRVRVGRCGAVLCPLHHREIWRHG